MALPSLAITARPTVGHLSAYAHSRYLASLRGCGAGQRCEDSEAGVGDRPFAVARDQEAAGERPLPRVVHRQRRLVRAVPLLGEVEAALLDPACEVAGADPVRRGQRRMADIG